MHQIGTSGDPLAYKAIRALEDGLNNRLKRVTLSREFEWYKYTGECRDFGSSFIVVSERSNYEKSSANLILAEIHTVLMSLGIQYRIDLNEVRDDVYFADIWIGDSKIKLMIPKFKGSLTPTNDLYWLRKSIVSGERVESPSNLLSCFKSDKIYWGPLMDYISLFYHKYIISITYMSPNDELIVYWVSQNVDLIRECLKQSFAAPSLENLCKMYSNIERFLRDLDGIAYWAIPIIKHMHPDTFKNMTYFGDVAARVENASAFDLKMTSAEKKQWLDYVMSSEFDPNKPWVRIPPNGSDSGMYVI